MLKYFLYDTCCFCKKKKTGRDTESNHDFVADFEEKIDYAKITPNVNDSYLFFKMPHESPASIGTTGAVTNVEFLNMPENNFYCPVPCIGPKSITNAPGNNETEQNKNNFRYLGEGSFFQVHLERWDKKYVAVKCSQPINQARQLTQQLQYLKSLNTLYCIEVLDVTYRLMSDAKTTIAISMTFMKHGSLAEWLTTTDAKTREISDILYIAKEIAIGMKYLEELSIVHADLKATNVLLDDSGHPKLADVGIRCALAKCSEFSPDWFPFDCWTAPELELHPGNFTIQADVWAFGILFYVLLTRRMNPYEGLLVERLSDHLANGNRPQKLQEIDDGLYSLLQMCWQYDPRDRPNFQRIFQWINESQHKYTNFMCFQK